MAEKPTYEALEQKVKTLEKEIVGLAKKNKAERESYDELKHEMERRSSELIEANQQLKHEIKEHAENEQALKNSQQLLKILIDNIEGEAFIKDKNGTYLFVNKAYGEHFGVDPEEVIGKDDYFIFSPENAAKLQENDQRIMASKKSEDIEESGVHKGKYAVYLTNKVILPCRKKWKKPLKTHISIWKEPFKKGLHSFQKLLINYVRLNCAIAL